jgi:glycosyltransferase involved in cell wall biosynthesis
MAASPVPRATVVIPHLNTPALLARCLASVDAQSLDHGSFEIIVIDNGSTTLPVAEVARHPRARLLTEATAGPGPARNTGIAAAQAPVIACIDADCIAAPGWLQAAVDAIEHSPGQPAGGDVQIAIATPPHMTGIEAYESVFGFRQSLYIHHRHFSVTANLAFARPLHARIGPFAGIDTAEDLDWGRRAHALGAPVRFVPAMLVLHPARPSYAALQSKWARHIAHDWNTRPPLWRWRLKALALPLSLALDGPRLLFSRRLGSAGNRLRGLGVLARIRCFRALEMWRLASGGSSHSRWNRP